MSDKKKAIIAVLLGSVLGGAVAAVTKVGLQHIPPFSYVFLRFLIAALLLFPFQRENSKKSIKIFFSLTPLSILATLNILLFIIGIKHTTATISQLLYAGTPLLTGIIGYLFLKQQVTRKQTIAIIIGFLGVAIIILLPVFDVKNIFSGSLVGNLFVALGVVSWAFYMTFSKVAQKQYSPLIITKMFIYLTAVISFPLFLWELISYYGWWNLLSISSVLSLLYVVILGTVGSYLLNQFAIRHAGSVSASLSFYILPIASFIAGYFFLGEQLTTGLIIGICFVFLGIVFFLKETR